MECLGTILAMAGEEELMRKRLTVEGDSGGDDRRITTVMKMFVKWCNNNQLSEEESETTCQKILFTLAQCEFSFHKTQTVMEMNRAEMERYEKVYSVIEEKIEEAKRQIGEYREELQRSRIIRRHRQEYDALAKVIQKHPTRQQSHKKIAELEATLEKLTRSLTALNRKLDTRRKQFYLLVHCIHQLEGVLEGEEEAEEMEGEGESQNEEVETMEGDMDLS